LSEPEHPSGFPLPTPAAFLSFPAPLQAALFTNEDPEESLRQIFKIARPDFKAGNLKLT
jgi:hypothetical protein